MKIIDTNIVIYATQPDFSYLEPLLRHPNSYVSEITKLEALGFHKFSTIDKQIMTDLFDVIQIIPINSRIIDQAILLKQAQKMSVGDAIIAATAILNNFEILTRNLSDFKRLNLRVSNPIL